jgi:hypothetical protein
MTHSFAIFAQENAYMVDELFERWMQQMFLPYTAEQRKAGPILLVYDNFSAHVTPAVLKLCAANNIEVIGLPPHSSNYLQPLDLSCNAPLKRYYEVNLDHWKARQLPGRAVTVQDLVVILAKPQHRLITASAWDRAFCPDNVMAGFAAAGIYPFNRNACEGRFKGNTNAEPAQTPAPASQDTPATKLIRAIMMPPPAPEPTNADTPEYVPRAMLLTTEEHLAYLEAEQARKAAQEAAAAERREQRALRAEEVEKERFQAARERHAKEFNAHEAEADPFHALNALQTRFTCPVVRSVESVAYRKNAVQRYLAKKRARDV